MCVREREREREVINLFELVTKRKQHARVLAAEKTMNALETNSHKHSGS